jgi:hypothetical protein
MNIFDKVKSFEFDRNRNRIFGIKSGIVWGHSKDTNGIFPLLYVSKPKHISQEDYELMLDSLELSFNIKKS